MAITIEEFGICSVCSKPTEGCFVVDGGKRYCLQHIPVCHDDLSFEQIAENVEPTPTRMNTFFRAAPRTRHKEQGKENCVDSQGLPDVPCRYPGCGKPSNAHLGADHGFVSPADRVFPQGWQERVFNLAENLLGAARTALEQADNPVELAAWPELLQLPRIESCPACGYEKNLDRGQRGNAECPVCRKIQGAVAAERERCAGIAEVAIEIFDHDDEDLPNTDGTVSDHKTDGHGNLVPDDRCGRCRAILMVAKIRSPE